VAHFFDTSYFVLWANLVNSVMIIPAGFPNTYTVFTAFAGESRYTDRAGDTWHAGGGPPAVKPFSSMGSGGVPPRDSWGPSGDRKADSGQNWGRPMDSGASDR
jgi:hypothetical protein